MIHISPFSPRSHSFVFKLPQLTQQVYALGQNLSKTIKSLMTLHHDDTMASSCGFGYRSIMSVVELPYFCPIWFNFAQEKFGALI